MKEILAKPRYRTPSVSIDANVSLGEFSFEQIASYMRHYGYEVSVHYADALGVDEPPIDGLFLTPEDLSRIATLSLCGQKQPARDLLLGIVGDAIGRQL